MVVATAARLWPASERTASEPEASPAANFAAVISALTAIEASAALSFSRLAPFIDLLVPRARIPPSSDLQLKHVSRGAARPRANAIYHGKACLAFGCIAGPRFRHRHRTK